LRARPDNELRFDPASGNGHVESYFVRANHPTKRLGLWLKATVFSPRPQSTVSDLWCVIFDGETEGGRIWAARRTLPFHLASFGGEPMAIDLRAGEFLLGADGFARGTLEGGGGPASWDVGWRAETGRLGESLSILPSDFLVDRPFPKSQTLTPMPLARFSGQIEVWGERISVEDWVGMQGHNWGSEHSWSYAWGQAFFLDAEGSPFCVVEGASTRLRLGPQTTPLLSTLVVRRRDREFRFSQAFAFWRQKASVGDLAWNLEVTSPDGEASLEVVASPSLTVCLGYQNPDGRLSYCLNSKLARARLRVNPSNDEGFECLSEHGAALEILQNTPDLRFDRVV
jgi:hypothetical protein